MLESSFLFTCSFLRNVQLGLPLRGSYPKTRILLDRKNVRNCALLAMWRLGQVN
jgi:hypothetical protein